jgi:cyclase
MMTEIAPGVYAADHAAAEGKNAIIVGQRGAWAIDAGTYPHEGQELADFIRSLGWPADRLIYTHGHGDHVLGSAAFRRAEVIAHALLAPAARRMLPAWAAKTGMTPEAVAASIAWPTLAFDGELTLDLGGRTLRLIPAPGHSPDGIVAYLPEERLLIAGDTVVTGIVPAIGHGDSRVLEATLGRLAELAIETLVPGHGPVITGGAAVQDWLRWEAGYLAGVRLAVRTALADGASPEAIPDRVSYERFVGDRLPADRHLMLKRHRDTAAVIVREERRNP